MNSQASLFASCATRAQSSQTRAVIASVGRIFKRLNRSKKRHTPTRMPYSCQLQFGTSGMSVCPVGGASTCRAIGLPMSQTSRLTMDQNTSRLRPGSFSGGRSTIAENSERSRGSIGFVRLLVMRFFIGRVLPGRRRRKIIRRQRYLRQLCRHFTQSARRDHILVSNRRIALQFAANRSCMEPSYRGPIIFPAFANLSLIAALCGPLQCHVPPFPSVFG